MIQRMSHSAIFVLDQDVAKDFYVNKLGFEVNMDQSMPNGFRLAHGEPQRAARPPDHSHESSSVTL